MQYVRAMGIGGFKTIQHGGDMDGEPNTQGNSSAGTTQHMEQDTDRYFDQHFSPDSDTNAPVIPISDGNEDAGSGTIKRKRTRSHRDPSEGGWDTTVISAPESHTSKATRKHSHHHHHHRRAKWVKPLIIVLIVIAALAGIAFGLFTWYMHLIDGESSFDGKTKSEVRGALTEASAGQPFYVLVASSDLGAGAAGSDEGTGALALLRVDAANSTLSALLIPRDTPHTDASGAIGKISLAHASDNAAGIIDAVKELTGLEISHYVEMDEGALERLIDNLGGVSVDLPAAFDLETATGEKVHLDKGLQHLNGEQALALSGARSLYEGAGRAANKQLAVSQVIAGITEAVTSRPALQIPGTISDSAACIKTDMAAGEILDLVKRIGKIPTIYAGIGPTNGAENPYVSSNASSSGHPWLCYVDEAGWENVLATLQAGKDPSAVSYAKDAVHFAGQPEETWSLGPVALDELSLAQEVTETTGI